jgi:hypothetical protein
MGVVIGQSTTGLYSTWAQLRCPLIKGYDQWNKYVGPGPQFHNLVVDEGFRPDEGYFVRVIGWPEASFWLDSLFNPHTVYNGPIVGWANVGSFSLTDSYFSIGSYDNQFNDQVNPFYTSIGNGLDEKDVTNCLIGLTVTYTSGTFTTTSDAFEQNPASSPWAGQAIGLLPITDVTAISTFTAF